jgi:hypothetical protein
VGDFGKGPWLWGGIVLFCLSWSRQIIKFSRKSLSFVEKKTKKKIQQEWVFVSIPPIPYRDGIRKVVDLSDSKKNQTNVAVTKNKIIWNGILILEVSETYMAHRTENSARFRLPFEHKFRQFLTPCFLH